MLSASQWLVIVLISAGVSISDDDARRSTRSTSDQNTGEPTETYNAEPPTKEALVTAENLIKYTLLFTTGVLVFSAGLVSEDINLTNPAKIFLLISWLSLTLSILVGTLALSRIPVMLSEGNYNIEDKYLTYPYRAFQALSMVGIVSVGLVLALALFSGGGETIESPTTAEDTPQSLNRGF